jgi:hypothetical protein
MPNIARRVTHQSEWNRRLYVGNIFVFNYKFWHQEQGLTSNRHIHRFYSGTYEDRDSHLITVEECRIDISVQYRVIMVNQFYHRGRHHRSGAFRTQNQIVWTLASRRNRQVLTRIRRA